MRLELICELTWAYQSQEIYGGKFLRLSPYGGQDAVGMGEIAGTVTGARLQGTLRCHNAPVVRSDGVVLPDVRGIIRTEDDAAILFTFQGRTIFDDPRGDAMYFATFASEDERYRWLNKAFCIFEGVINPRMGGRIYMCLNEYDTMTVVEEHP